MTDPAFDLSTIRTAASRIAPHVRQTPLLEDPAINERCGGRVLVKAEVLQHTGSFKFRGACNAVLSLPQAERQAGLLAFSSGNHAQAVARMGSLLGVPTTIVMPQDAPAVKIEGTRAFGADVRFYDRYTEDREVVAAEILAQGPRALVKPFDDPAIMAGQGTIGLEVAAACEADGLSPSVLLCPVSGGGLLSGVATALQARFPDLEPVGVEPEGYDDFALSLAAGERREVIPTHRSICDAIMGRQVGAHPWAALRRLCGVRAAAVSDQAVLEAMALALQRLKLVVEPGGAAGLAALLCGQVPLAGRTAVVVLSGGNVDTPLLRRALCGDCAGLGPGLG